MEVGHPVTVPSGAHGIITALRPNGMTDVDLVGGATVRVPYTELKSYFETPMPEGEKPVTAQPVVEKLPPVIPSTVTGSVRFQIITILKVAGEQQKLTGKEILARGNFESSVGMYSELSGLYRKHKVLGRDKRPIENRPAVYQYWLIPGVKLPLYGDEADPPAGKEESPELLKAGMRSGIEIPTFVDCGYQIKTDDGLDIDKPITAPQGQTIVEPLLAERKDRNLGGVSFPSDVDVMTKRDLPVPAVTKGITIRIKAVADIEITVSTVAEAAEFVRAYLKEDYKSCGSKKKLI